MFSNNRQQLRKTFFDVWEKTQENTHLAPAEKQIADIIFLHPEYHTTLAQPEKYLDKDYLPEGGELNPFLHMSLHLSIRDQISTNRPEGITPAYQQLSAKLTDQHELEHRMMNCLAETLWQQQQPIEQLNHYLTKIRALL
jgi:hypothetical protein